MMKRRRTPAATKMLDARATLTLKGRVAHTMRIIRVVIRAMQKPNIMPDMMKRCPLFLLIW